MKISTLGNGGQENRPVGTPYVSTRVDPANYGAAVAEGVQQLGAGVGKAGEAIEQVKREEKDKTDAAQSFGVYGKIGEWENKNLFDPKTGFLSLQGENAIGKGDKPLADEYLQDFDKLGDSLRKSAANEDQLRVTNKLLQQKREQVFRQMAAHESRQNEVVREGKYRSALDAAVNNAASAPADPESLKAAKTLGEGAVLIRGQTEGWSGEQTQQELGKFRTEMHVSVLKSMAKAGQGDLAEKYLKQNAAEIDGRVRQDVEEMVSVAGVKLRGEALAQQAAGAGRTETPWLSEAAAREHLEKTLEGATPALKDEARRRLDERVNDDKRLKNEAVVSHFNSALESYRSRGRLSDVSADDRAFLMSKNNDPTAWERLLSIARSNRSEVESGPASGEQERALADFLVDAADNPDKYATMSVQRFNNEWAARLHPRDAKRAVSVLAEIHSGANKARPLAPTEQGMLLNTGREAGIFPSKGNDVSKWSQDEASVFYAASQQVSERTAEFRRANGKQPSLEEQQGWARELFLKGKVPGSGLLFEDHTTRIQSELEGKPFTPEFTKAEKTAAEVALKNAGARRIDDAAVEQYLRRRYRLPSLPTQAAKPKAPEPKAEPTTPPRADLPTLPVSTFNPRIR